MDRNNSTVLKKADSTPRGNRLEWLVLSLIPILLFWLILLVNVPVSFSQYFHAYSLPLFIIVIVLYYGSYSYSGKIGFLLSLGLTMVLLSLSLSYLWKSGFSDNFLIGGLLPYKDGKNYYLGANLILNGLPLVNAGQATERPLFPGFLAVLLWLTGQNLKITLGLIVQVAGISFCFSARQARNSFGLLAASLFATLLYFYIQPLAGYTLSELLGFIAGCWAFTMLVLGSNSLKWWDLMLGAAILMIGVSARAGAFFVFPLLVIWVGRIFRGEKRFAWKPSLYALAAIAVLFFLANSIYARFLGIPPGSAFGNFSYALYGQVRGGTGWHTAIEELGTREPAAVYQAAMDFFLRHPASLLIGVVKAYRDFFGFENASIFPFYSRDRFLQVLNLLLWLGMLALMIVGIIQLFKRRSSPLESLLLAMFIGIILSIPFLPPIDGGSRFHAATVPFFFAVFAVGIQRLSRKREAQLQTVESSSLDLVLARYASILLLALVLIAPILIRGFSVKPIHTVSICPAGQQSFAIVTHPGTQLDIIQSGLLQCGKLPNVCLRDFETNNTEFSTDDFYQYLAASTKSISPGIRIIPAFDLLRDKFYYFQLPLDSMSSSSAQQILGCGVETRTKNQTIFQVKSVFSYGN